MSIDFCLDEQEGLSLKTSHSEALIRFSQVEIIFYDNLGNDYKLYSDNIFRALIKFEDLLRAVLSYKFVLNSSINPTSRSQDIGYLWNETLRDKDYIIKKIGEDGIPYWAGEKYILWLVNKPRLTTWLYNWDNKIIFEVTPNWNYDEPKKNKNYMTYEKFLKNYKPCLFKEIPKETAETWLKQVQELLAVIKINDRKYLKIPCDFCAENE